MGRFKHEYLPVNGRETHLESHVTYLWGEIDRQQQVAGKVDALRSAAIQAGERELVSICDDMMAQNFRQIDVDQSTSLVGMSENNRPDQYTEERRRIAPRNKTRMTQLIQLMWRGHFFRYADSEEENPTLNDVNYWMGEMLGIDFNSWSNNLSQLYKCGNWGKLKEEIANAIDTQQSLITEIDKWANQIHEERRP